MVVIMTSVYAIPASAEVELPVPELLPDEPDVGEAISPMRKGQRAPFTGVLLSPKAVAKLTVELNSIEEKIEIEKEKVLKACQAECSFKVTNADIESRTDIKILKAKLESEEKENKILQKRVEKLEKDRPNVTTWTFVGFLTGVVATVAIVFGVSEAKGAAQ